MNQEQKIANPGGTGSTCAKTGLYKATDGRIESIQYVEQGKPFPAFPGGTGKTVCSWSALSSADSSRKTFTPVKVATGSV